ncbi:MAG: type I-E CRISPR-associated protein Cas6/Cse3/CasE [Bifidobacteriaceae bacterium]|nr:type I-E CRISPR-associated protein Cas6/Cse3/CasE [Bifidobacteriaceae bacterium]
MPKAQDEPWTSRRIHDVSMSLFPDRIPAPNARSYAGVLCQVVGHSLFVQSTIAPTKVPKGFHLRGPRRWNPSPGRSMRISVILAAEANGSGGPALLPRELRVRRRPQAIPLAEREQWARTRLACHGLLMAPDSAAICGEQESGYQDRPPIAWVRLSGVAEVIDHRAATEALVKGIGRGKPYGMGLVRLIGPPDGEVIQA